MVQVTVPSLAKLNLDLRVLHKRPDGYHELRTIFQTISLRDSLKIGFESQRRSEILLNSSVDIPDNLIVRAAHLVCERFKIRGAVQISLKKKIPMGAGLGGGSSNAAATLIALPALAGKHVTAAELSDLGAILGSDVPFFLHGGTALGLGRGTEIYPLPEQPARHVLIVYTGIHVSTGEAYRALERSVPFAPDNTVTNALTSPPEFLMLREFQAIAWASENSDLQGLALTNDFEKPVFQTHRSLAAVVRKLRQFGATLALMTGSGSALFGIFPTADRMKTAAEAFPGLQVFPVRFVPRTQYRQLWRRSLGQAAESVAGLGFN